MKLLRRSADQTVGGDVIGRTACVFVSRAGGAPLAFEGGVGGVRSHRGGLASAGFRCGCWPRRFSVWILEALCGLGLHELRGGMLQVRVRTWVGFGVSSVVVLGNHARRAGISRTVGSEFAGCCSLLASRRPSASNCERNVSVRLVRWLRSSR